MTRSDVFAAGALAALTLAGFFLFPGHTWLQQDTQIYVPILKHLQDSMVLAQDAVATHPHVTYTLYDEIALASPLELKTTLQLQQLAFRFLALFGVYLMGWRVLGDRGKAVLIAGIFGLGATITGPAVLTMEYEPVPRGFAINLIFLALGLVAWEKWFLTGLAAAGAFLYHPPTAIPFWTVAVFVWVAARRIPDAERLLAPLAAGAALLFGAAKTQRGEREAQHLFDIIDPDLEKLQRLRAPYNWLSMWPGYWWWHYPIYGAISLGALGRLRRETPRALALFAAGLTLVGIVMMPVSYVLQEVEKWSAMSSYQPARAVLFCTALGVIFAAMAAARAESWWESYLWLIPAYAIPVNTKLFTDDWDFARVGLVLGLSALTTAAFRMKILIAVAAAAPILLIPSWGHLQNYPSLHSPELGDISGWALTQTPKETVFQFAGFGKRNVAGIFRANAERALYVDWKGGGQVNLLKKFADQWWERWRAAAPEKYDPAKDYGALGIDYVVVPAEQAGVGTAYRNRVYAVVDVRRTKGSTQ